MRAPWPCWNRHDVARVRPCQPSVFSSELALVYGLGTWWPLLLPTVPTTGRTLALTRATGSSGRHCYFPFGPRMSTVSRNKLGIVTPGGVVYLADGWLWCYVSASLAF